MKALVRKILAHSSHYYAQHSIFPILCQSHVPIQLVVCHSLWIDSLCDARFISRVEVVRALKRLPNRCLGASGKAEEHDGVSHVQKLLKITRLVHEHLFIL